jgi:uncharacterized protein YjbJ (UPF0337 family)
MYWGRIAGKWWQLKDQIRKRWSRLTDVDLEVIGGRKDKLVVRIQERYGVVQEEAERQVNEWSKTAHRRAFQPSRSILQLSRSIPV